MRSEEIMIQQSRGMRWGLLALLLITVIVYPVFEQRYQTMRQRGWVTYFSTERQDCDLSNAHIFVDTHERVWVLGNGECDFFNNAHIFNGKTWSEMKIDGEYIDQYIIDLQDQLWRRRENKGDQGRLVSVDIGKFDGKEWSLYASVDINTLDERFTNANFAIDKEGRLWLTFLRLPPSDNPVLWTTGLSIFDKNGWNTYTADNSPALASERIYGPVFDSQQRAWFVAEEDGLKLFDGTNWVSYSAQKLNLAKYGNIISLAFDRNGDPWVATTDGFLVSVDNGLAIDWTQGLNLKHKLYLSKDTDYFHFAFDQSGRIWITYWADPDGQITIFDGKSWATLTKENSGLSGDEITELEIDGQGNVWVGTPTGVIVFSPDDELPTLTTDNLWIKLRGNQRAFIGTYWLLPFLLFLLWFALMFPKDQRLSAIGLMFGICEGVLLILAVLFMTIFQGFNRYSLQPLSLLIPFGLIGLIVSMVAVIQLRQKDTKVRNLARLGFVFSIIGVVIGILWRLLTAVIFRF